MKADKLVKLSAYMLVVSIWFYTGCSGGDEPEPFDCDTSDLGITLEESEDVSGCTASDGLIEVTATGGKTPYQFKLDNGAFQATGIFTNISAGSHVVTVKDGNNCEVELDVEIGITGNDLFASKVEVDDTECLGNNGSVTITVTGGTAPYDIRLGGTTLSTNPATFSNLGPGTYVITVEDSEGCEFPVIASIDQVNTGIDYTNDILPIFQAKCNFSGCHPDNGNWFNYTIAKDNAQKIKTNTGNGTMPKGGSSAPGGALSASQIALIACWVDGGAPEN